MIVRLVACCVLLSAALAFAEEAPLGPTRDDDLEASIRELEAHKKDADPATLKMLEQQIQNIRDVLKMKKASDAEAAKNKAARPKLSDAAKKFYAPVPAAKLPTWLPDTLIRADAKEAMLKCPAGAKAYADVESMDCRVPRGPGAIPVPNGLALWFYSTGKLKAQRFYEQGKLRWDVSYYAVGGRESEGAYDSVEPKTYREDGLHTSYAPNGTVTGQATYKSGVKTGWSKLWDDDGYPIGAFRYDGGKVVESVGPTGPAK